MGDRRGRSRVRVYRVPRREGRAYGTIEQAITFRGGTDTGWISQRFYQHPSGGPVFLAKQYDGRGVFAELWRDTANKVGIRYPNFGCVGVTKNGWVVGSYAH